ncbi:Gfo/Idh/MocA family protein [Nocardioides pacificus]
MTTDTDVRWGILATGKIAHTFARDLAATPGARLVAVGSRSVERSQEFADEFDTGSGADSDGGSITAYGSYAELVADPDVEVVYVATPHSRHLADARLALEAGKHVLCEKPLTLNVAEAEQMVALARERGLFLMEAMWTACHPLVKELRSVLATGRLGTPRALHAELGFRVDASEDDRMLNPALGASALLDMGIYPLTFAHLLLGPAEELRASATLSDAGIDLDVAMTGRYPGGALATMSASMTSWSSRAAAIATDLGRIDIVDFHHPTSITFTPYDARGADAAGHAEPVAITTEEPVLGQGYGNEIAEVGRCLRAGLVESPLVPHEQTLTLMRQLDAIRAQIGVDFPDGR